MNHRGEQSIILFDRQPQRDSRDDFVRDSQCAHDTALTKDIPRKRDGILYDKAAKIFFTSSVDNCTNNGRTKLLQMQNFVVQRIVNVQKQNKKMLFGVK
jgi:hypothetical protein